jgi:hypothetical protein
MLDPQILNDGKWKRSRNPIKTRAIKNFDFNLQWKNINYSKPETECTFKQIMFLYLLRIIQKCRTQ